MISVGRIHQKVLSGQASFASEIEAALARAAAASHLNAFISLAADRARDSAKQADAVLARNGGRIPDALPLLGIPVAIKDNLQWKGARTTCASKILEGYVSPFTATSVARLEQAGAVIIGKCNLDEFAMGGSGEHSAFGPTLNPIDLTRVPGGSSSGSGAAVGAGVVPVALGSDTGGSIRLPASFCGITGLKPTYGQVSRHGLVAFASSLDQVGPMGATVEDVEKVFMAIRGKDPMDATSSSAALVPARELQGLKIGVPAEFFPDDSALHPEVKKVCHSALAKLESKGARLVPVRLPHVHHSLSVYYVIAVAEASSNLSRFDGVRFGCRTDRARSAASLEEFYCENRSLFGKEAKRRILLGTFVLSAGLSEAYYGRACEVREWVSRDFEEAFGEVDVIASPVAPTPAFKLGEQSASPLQMYLNDLYTIPANLAGLPAISIPAGRDSSGLPIGIQLMAAHHCELTLLAAGRALEES